MKDFVPKGTGNSRYLRSVSDFITRYPTYEAFAAALVAGKLPVDFAGLNPEGITQIGTPANKETLLTDATETALFGTANDRTVNEALAKVAGDLTDLGLLFRHGSYIGTGTYRDTDPNTLTFDSQPIILIVQPDAATGISSGAYNINGWNYGLLWMYGGNSVEVSVRTTSGGSTYVSGAQCSFSVSGNTVSWYSYTNAQAQRNESGKKYNYVALCKQE